jgi:protease PrsW
MILFLILLAFISIAVGLAWYFISHDRGEKEPVSTLWIAFGFGFAGGVAAAIIENFFVSTNDLSPSSSLSTIFVAAMTIGVIEEACKFLPLAIYIYPKRYFNEYTDGIIYFALAGLGFGLPENILYSIQFGAATGFSRIFLTPFFHAATTGLVGYFLIRAKMGHHSRLQVGLVLVGAMILHGLYDFGLASGVPIFMMISIALTITASALLFYFYLRATILDQQLGVSAVGHNNFCRACGQANPDHHLYCTRCGRRA